MGMAAAQITYLTRGVIDAEGFPVARPRRPDTYARPQSQETQRAQQPRDQRSAAILAFAQRVAQHFDAESTGTEGESGQAAWRQPAESNYPISTFLAQHIAQERLNEGLTLDPYAGATGAYARSGQLAASGAAAGLDIAV